MEKGIRRERVHSRSAHPCPRCLACCSCRYVSDLRHVSSPTFRRNWMPATGAIIICTAIIITHATMAVRKVCRAITAWGDCVTRGQGMGMSARRSARLCSTEIDGLTAPLRDVSGEMRGVSRRRQEGRTDWEADEVGDHIYYLSW